MTKLRKVWTALVVGLVLATLLALTGSAWARNSNESPLPQPDGNVYLPAADISNAGFSPIFSYAFVAGSALHPVDSDTTWNYESYGCVSAGGTALFNADLDLPEGSRIDYLRIYYRDTSANNSIGWITTYDGAGGYDDLTYVQSSGSGGYGTQLSAYVGDVVDNHDNSYVLNWRANQNGNTMRLCGFRVAYRLPAKEVYLPISIKGS